MARQDFKAGNQLGRGGSVLDTDQSRFGRRDPTLNHLAGSFGSVASTGSLRVMVKTGPVTENFFASTV